MCSLNISDSNVWTLLIKRKCMNTKQELAKWGVM